MDLKSIQKFTFFYMIIILLGFWNSSFTFCPFYITTHLPCPGCGMTTAIVLFLKGDWTLAFKYHAFSILVLLVMILIFLDWILEKLWKISFLKNLFSKKVMESGVIIVIFLFILYGIIRIWILLYMPDIYLNYFVDFKKIPITDIIKDGIIQFIESIF